METKNKNNKNDNNNNPVPFKELDFVSANKNDMRKIKDGSNSKKLKSFQSFLYKTNKN